MKTKNFKRVYVWEVPVRIFHWINVLSLTVLVLSGFLIANPPALLSNAEPFNLHMFGTVRFLHFSAAYIFFFNMILRIYWSFVGNQFSNWRAFWPFTKKNWSNFKHVLKIDILLKNDKIPQDKDISIGHNSVATFSYLVMFFVALIQIATGFGLYADSSSFWLPKLFNWVVPLLGGDFMTRTVHHITTWVFIFFALVHIYLVFYHDWLEGRGEVSSMFGGYKFVNNKRIKNN
ncbi:MAG: Ni/Fe-hydrogenase, b-type cytochrome subunit [Flavobacteriales bacterium CG_4_8_14_3_um_filter_35_10]|nr:Ni/Fe-hydrogenase, b-type cytochrome subunit [Zetaproteobacteria bacterium]OIO12430.1 MAG: Ni/Fe-hydrogenase, b-type cytochrome subunit [Flavobacteriaceae bacterium CG1_02_35_72]PIX07971.1 MAG: Ni/Fe-hydrogenase, b-type cytochrome subunit [Flavobacteriales bacterium CG_4_8_14_3_um_filter_35_10]PJA05124.1 MAG: Ni/Fe-hydrogenase, b-type cytochrome subunit [Flavobacteriales bacterium CG_4_10_14_0_2_um_filter_35_18]